MNEHNYLVALDPPRESPPRRWKCKHCGVEGLLVDVQHIPCSASRPASDVEVLEAIEGEKS